MARSAVSRTIAGARRHGRPFARTTGRAFGDHRARQHAGQRPHRRAGALAGITRAMAAGLDAVRHLPAGARRLRGVAQDPRGALTGGVGVARGAAAAVSAECYRLVAAAGATLQWLALARRRAEIRQATTPIVG